MKRKRIGLWVGLAILFTREQAVALTGGTNILVQNGTIAITGQIAPANGGTGSANTATTGRYLKGDGTNFVTSSGSASGVGTCTNQFARVLNSDAAPTCAAVSLTADVTGVLATANGGTDVSSAADNQTLVSNGTVFQVKTIGDCTGSGKALTYADSGNAFGCNTISAGVNPILAFSTNGNIIGGAGVEIDASPGVTDNTRARGSQIASNTMTLDNLRCVSSVDPGGSAQSYTVTLVTAPGTDAGGCGTYGASTLVCTIATGAKRCADAVSGVSVTAGDCYVFDIDASATAATGVVSCNVERTG